ncbi:MAG TPA: class I SAM-dependent methyltransferase [Rugosimonospora sp.]|nr:class I SAM-dependent methyltransferase [Rugosimonospora sp.]
MWWEPVPEEEVRAARNHEDVLAMQALAPLSSTYLPWTVSAMRPAGVTAVLNEIVVNRRRTIVELGGGVSTYYIGRLLSQQGGHLWSVEHDEEWAGVLERQLAREGLGDVVTVVRAPLVPALSPWPDEEACWYTPDVLKQTLAEQRIDLLLVDGPPAWQADRSHARYPAFPFFAPMLADNYTVILDDVDRPGEQDILDAWERELGITFQRRRVCGVIGVGRSAPGFTI